VFHNGNNGNLPPGFPFEPLSACRHKEIPLPVLQIVRHAQSWRGHRIDNSSSKESRKPRRDKPARESTGRAATYRNLCQLPDRNQNTGGGIIYLNANNKLRLANTIARAEKAEGLELIS
jgi:hypothetical protein